MQAGNHTWIRNGRCISTSELYPYLISLGIGIIALELFIIFMQYTELDVIGFISSNFNKYRALTGYVWAVFLLLGAIGFVASIAFTLEAIGVITLANEKLPIDTLGYIEQSAPLLGLLQTFISLRFSQLSLDVSLEQAELLTLLARQAGAAYGSTIAGIVLALFAFTVRRIFEIKKGGSIQ